MRGTAGRALAVLLLAAPLAGCSAGAPAAPAASLAGPSAPGPSLPVPSAPAGAASSPAPAPPPSPGQVQQLTLAVKDGRVTGDTGTVAVARGRPVRLTVTSDVADEVHVHGADVRSPVAAGGTVVLDLVQRAPGRFEVELEGRRQVLTRLQVR